MRAPISLRVADPSTRQRLYTMRHAVYADELAQHPENAEGLLTDALDAVNVYLVAEVEGEIAGFVSITPPNPLGYSIDKYFARQDVDVTFDDGLHEVRLLTVRPEWRGSRVAAALMYAAWRYVDAAGGRSIVCIGRLEVLDMYTRVGLRRLGLQTRCGAVTFELMRGDLSDGSASLQRAADDLERHVEWKVEGVRFRPKAPCYHGGAFFDAIGDEFTNLGTRDRVINADVLDAWFDPAPAVLDAVRAHLPWILKTSPPTGCDGMHRAIARARGVESDNVLAGAGSSDLIFLALRKWVRPRSRVLILDPMYGEYAHVLERVIGCTVDRLTLRRGSSYRVDVDELGAALRQGYDWVILVNPNSPTGQHISRDDLATILAAAPPRTRFWIDETYIEYAGATQSVERFAARSANVVVCKSMSKVYALSGARSAYLCGPAALIDELRGISPPWSVSLPGQIAACEALRNISYYEARWRQTHDLREKLASALAALGWDVLPGCANFLLCHLPDAHPEASALVAECRRRGLFIRDVAGMGRCFDSRTVRVAVKDARTNERIVEILSAVLADFGADLRTRVLVRSTAARALVPANG